jgi:hypothetical protein
VADARALREWNFGPLDQRFDPGAWEPILARIGLTIVTPTSVALLACAAVATFLGPQRRFWLAMWGAALGPMLVFTNLYVRHDYYLAAISPAVAALVGLVVGFVWSHLPRRRLVTAGALLVGLLLVYSTLEFGRSYWLRIHGAEDDPAVLPLAAQIAAHTEPDDRIALARRLDTRLPLLREALGAHGRRRNRGCRLRPHPRARLPLLRRLRPHGPAPARALALRRRARPEPLRAQRRTPGGRKRVPGRNERSAGIRANASAAHARLRRSYPSRADPGVRRLAELRRPDASARLWASSDELAGVPLRRYAWVDVRLARAGEVALRCTRP